MERNVEFLVQVLVMTCFFEERTVRLCARKPHDIMKYSLNMIQICRRVVKTTEHFIHHQLHRYRVFNQCRQVCPLHQLQQPVLLSFAYYLHYLPSSIILFYSEAL